MPKGILGIPLSIKGSNLFKTPYYSTDGVVASENPISSTIGSDILKKGGNAVDSAIAVSLSLAVTAPHLGGLGGDFFALVKTPDEEVMFFNGSGYSPKEATLEKLKSLGLKEVPHSGPLSITVPGMIDGLALLWKSLGTMEWKDLIKPAIKLAKKGFPVSRGLASALRDLKSRLWPDEGSRKTYYPGGRLLKEGDILKLSSIGKALELIAEDPRSFYEGDIALRIVDYLRKLGGLMDYEDLKIFKAYEGKPLSITYKGMKVYEMPPNTQGITTLHILQFIKDLDPSKINSSGGDRVKAYLKAFIKAYTIRDNYITDPKYMRVKPEDLLNDELLNSEEIGKVGSDSLRRSSDTTFFTVIDAEGYVVAGIQSLFYHFGSYVTEPTYGITLNSRGSSFKLDPLSINKLEPRKRPMHTLSAMIVESKNSVRAIGLSGGHYRPQLHVQIFSNIYDYGMHPQNAIEHPRFVWEPYTNVLRVEEGFSEIDLGHYIIKESPYPSRLGVAAISEIRSNGIRGAYCDIRGDGIPAGTY